MLSYGAAGVTARLGYHWLDFGDRPEIFAVLELIVFVAPLAAQHQRHTDFPAVYRFVGALAFLTAVLALSEWGGHSYLPMETANVERIYEIVGLTASAGAMWLGIVRQWDGVVNTSSVFFTIFLFCRLYHWWWDTMPKYLFFAVIGAIAIALVVGFKRVRARLVEGRAV